MNNARRRKEMLIIACLVGNARQILSDEQMRPFVVRPFEQEASLQAEFRKAVPIETLRREALVEAQLVVSRRLIPKAYMSLNPAAKLYLAVGFVTKLVQSGWKMPTGMAERGLIQACYDCAMALNLKDKPTGLDNWLEAMVIKARALGLFK